MFARKLDSTDFYVVIHPWSSNPALVQQLRTAGITVLDYSGAFERDGYSLPDIHPNAAGHKKLAKMIAADIAGQQASR